MSYVYGTVVYLFIDIYTCLMGLLVGDLEDTCEFDSITKGIDKGMARFVPPYYQLLLLLLLFFFLNGNLFIIPHV